MPSRSAPSAKILIGKSRRNCEFMLEASLDSRTRTSGFARRGSSSRFREMWRRFAFRAVEGVAGREIRRAYLLCALPFRLRGFERGMRDEQMPNDGLERFRMRRGVHRVHGQNDNANVG